MSIFKKLGIVFPKKSKSVKEIPTKYFELYTPFDLNIIPILLPVSFLLFIRKTSYAKFVYIIINYSMEKIFCLGLHKTGTTSLHDIARNLGYHSIHSTNWHLNPAIISRHNFFCDGGSHYNNLNEFNYKKLIQLYPNSKFIINIRNIDDWIISKLKHAGWNARTKPDQSKEERHRVKYHHHCFTLKTLKNINLFIQHYLDWYIKIICFFMDKKEKAIVVDITNSYNIDKLAQLLKQPSISISHKNKTSSHRELSDKVKAYIHHQIHVVNKDKLIYLNKIVSLFDSP